GRSPVTAAAPGGTHADTSRTCSVGGMSSYGCTLTAYSFVPSGDQARPLSMSTCSAPKSTLPIREPLRRNTNTSLSYNASEPAATSVLSGDSWTAFGYAAVG